MTASFKVSTIGEKVSVKSLVMSATRSGLGTSGKGGMVDIAVIVDRVDMVDILTIVDMVYMGDKVTMVDMVGMVNMLDMLSLLDFMDKMDMTPFGYR